MSMEILNLRRATINDIDLIFEWANDPLTRAQSFSNKPIQYDTHVAWFNKKIDDPGCFMYVLEYEGEPCGTIRVDQEKDAGIISYNIAPYWRGRGLGVAILKLLEGKIKSDAPNIHILKGEVKLYNLSSQKCFEYIGYTKTFENEYYLYTLTI